MRCLPSDAFTARGDQDHDPDDAGGHGAVCPGGGEAAGQMLVAEARHCRSHASMPQTQSALTDSDVKMSKRGSNPRLAACLDLQMRSTTSAFPGSGLIFPD